MRAIKLNLFLLIVLGPIVAAHGQGRYDYDSVELLRRYGPHEGVLQRTLITRAIHSLEWQPRLSAAQIQRLEAIQADWEQKAVEVQRELSEIRRDARRQGLPLTQESLSRLSEKQIEATVTLKGALAKMEFLQSSLQRMEQEEAEFAKQEKEIRLDQLARQVEQRQRNLLHAERLHERRFLPEGELAEAQLELQLAEAELKLAESKPERPSQTVNRIKEQLQLVNAEVREAESIAEQFTHLLAAADPAVDRVAELQAELDFYREMSAETRREIARIQLARTEADALLELVRQQISQDQPDDNDD